MRSLIPIVLPALSLCTVALAQPNFARANGLAACGNIHVEASAECTVYGGVECEGRCTPVSFEAACAGQLQLQCEGQCNASAELSCTGSCEASCQGECQANPGNFECSGSCKADCSGSCDAECSAAGNKGECRASCEAQCGASCDARCEGTPPSASCEAKCAASCEGSCEARANMGCQVDCQGELFGECKVQMEGGCKLDCEAGAGMFCDGQYVDHGGNLKKCADALAALFNIVVKYHASAKCEKGRCEAEASASITCALDPRPRGELGWLLALGLAVGVYGLRRQRLA